MCQDNNRPALLQQMKPPAQEVAQYVQATLAAEQRQGLLVRHEIGLRLDEVVEEKAIYGSQAVQQIAEYVGLSADRLYKQCAYAQAYSREQLEQ